jgi:hypothetical protein
MRKKKNDDLIKQKRHKFFSNEQITENPDIANEDLKQAHGYTPDPIYINQLDDDVRHPALCLILYRKKSCSKKHMIHFTKLLAIRSGKMFFSTSEDSERPSGTELIKFRQDA